MRRNCATSREWHRFSAVNRQDGKAWVWKELRREGDVVAVILDAAEEADLIVMATEGRQDIFDALRGSVTERVVRGAPCPVLAVPTRRVALLPGRVGSNQR